MSDNSNDFGAFLAGFVIGGLVGAATALILAPQSGEQTRHQIASKSENLREASGERVAHYRQLSTEKLHTYQERANELLNTGQEAAETVAEQTRIVLDEGQDKVEEVITTVESESEGDDEETEA